MPLYLCACIYNSVCLSLSIYCTVWRWQTDSVTALNKRLFTEVDVIDSNISTVKIHVIVVLSVDQLALFENCFVNSLQYSWTISNAFLCHTLMCHASGFWSIWRKKWRKKQLPNPGLLGYFISFSEAFIRDVKFKEHLFCKEAEVLSWFSVQSKVEMTCTWSCWSHWFAVI